MPRGIIWIGTAGRQSPSNNPDCTDQNLRMHYASQAAIKHRSHSVREFSAHSIAHNIASTLPVRTIADIHARFVQQTCASHRQICQSSWFAIHCMHTYKWIEESPESGTQAGNHIPNNSNYTDQNLRAHYASQAAIKHRSHSVRGLAHSIAHNIAATLPVRTISDIHARFVQQTCASHR